MSKQVFCITGGANGLGRQLAAYFSLTSTVVILDIDAKTLPQVADKFGCDFQVCDVTDSDSINKAIKNIIKKYHQIDCFINSAGIYIDGEIESNNPDKIKKVFEVNSLGPVLTSQAIVPYLKKQKSGTIININSTAGLHPKAFNSVYHSSKWALTGFTESLQAELATFKIKVVNLRPGVMNTNFTKGTNTDLSHSLDPHYVVKAIDFVLAMPPEVTISELTIKHL